MLLPWSAVTFALQHIIESCVKLFATTLGAHLTIWHGQLRIIQRLGLTSRISGSYSLRTSGGRGRRQEPNLILIDYTTLVVVPPYHRDSRPRQAALCDNAPALGNIHLDGWLMIEERHHTNEHADGNI